MTLDLTVLTLAEALVERKALKLRLDNLARAWSATPAFRRAIRRPRRPKHCWPRSSGLLATWSG